MLMRNMISNIQPYSLNRTNKSGRTMNCAIYIRVSTEDQVKEGYSLEVQREYLVSFAEREGQEIFKIYQDGDISGYSTEHHTF